MEGLTLVFKSFQNILYYYRLATILNSSPTMLVQYGIKFITSCVIIKRLTHLGGRCGFADPQKTIAYVPQKNTKISHCNKASQSTFHTTRLRRICGGMCFLSMCGRYLTYPSVLIQTSLSKLTPCNAQRTFILNLQYTSWQYATDSGGFVAKETKLQTRTSKNSLYAIRTGGNKEKTHSVK